MAIEPRCPHCEYAYRLFMDAGFDMSKVEINHPAHAKALGVGHRWTIPPNSVKGELTQKLIGQMAICMDCGTKGYDTDEILNACPAPNSNTFNPFVEKSK
jgi:hypothetical protein